MAAMALALPSPAPAPERNAAWLWHAVKLLALLCAVALAVRLGQVPPTSAARSAPPPPAARAAPAPEPVPVVLRRLELDRPLEHGDFAWNPEGAPAGRIRIEIDLSTETLSVFRGGHEIGRAFILYGTDDKPTPTGSFRITQKNADHVSNIYDAPMPWMLRLTNDGIAIHGSIVEWGSATRGCVGVPDEFARLLFAEAKLGDRVTITDGGA